MTDAVSAARKAQLEAKPYLLEKGWRETAMPSHWADPLTAEVLSFNVAWDRQFERDWAEKEGITYCLMLRPLRLTDFPAKVLGLFSRLDLAVARIEKFIELNSAAWEVTLVPEIDRRNGSHICHVRTNAQDQSRLVVTAHKRDQ